MNIRFVSSLTPEDENRFASALAQAVSSLLSELPIAYTLRIETSDAHVIQDSRVFEEDPGLSKPRPEASHA